MPLGILYAASRRTNRFTDGIGNTPPDILSRESSGRPIAGVVGYQDSSQCSHNSSPRSR